MRKRYKNPPLVEAICEFHFQEVSDWDLTTPGLVYEQLKGDFPLRKSIRQTGVAVVPEDQENGPRFEHREREVVKFISSNEAISVQISPHVLTITHKKPYSSWEDFLPAINRGLEALRSALPAVGIERIELNYVNRIEIPTLEHDLEEYFNFRPFLGGSLPQKISSFIVGAKFPYDDSNDSARIQLVSVSTEEDSNIEFAAILDIEYFNEDAEELSRANIFSWLSNAHERINKLFESSITPQLRLIFEEG